MLSSVMNVGVQGIQSGMRQLDQSANDVARAAFRSDTKPVDTLAAREGTLEQAVVEQIASTYMVKANVRTVEVASENLGTLIDMKV